MNGETVQTVSNIRSNIAAALKRGVNEILLTSDF